MKNEETARAFAAKFDPPLTVAGFERIAGITGGFASDGWRASGRVGEAGITAIVTGDGDFRAWVEVGPEVVIEAATAEEVFGAL